MMQVLIPEARNSYTSDSGELKAQLYSLVPDSQAPRIKGAPATLAPMTAPRCAVVPTHRMASVRLRAEVLLVTFFQLAHFQVALAAFALG